MMNILAFDIGGTEIKYGIISDDNCLIFHQKMLTDSHLGGLHILNIVLNKINELRKEFEFSGVAISSCGVIDVKNGKVKYANDIIQDYTNIEFVTVINDNFNLPSIIENDVNCFSLAEGYFGAGRDVNNYLTLTIGTGIGGAIVINKQIYHGIDYSAGEVGQMRIVNQTKFESLASMKSLISVAKKEKLHIENGIELFKLYDDCDPTAISVVKKFYEYLALGITNLAYIFNPEKIIIGGGISNRGNKFLDELNIKINKVVDPHYFGSTKIEVAQLKNHGGMFGAYVVFKQQFPHMFK